MALTDFLDSQMVSKKIKWELLKEKVYIAVSGYLADLWYSSGEQRIHIVIDVWNKLYTVVEII